MKGGTGGPPLTARPSLPSWASLQWIWCSGSDAVDLMQWIWCSGSDATGEGRGGRGRRQVRALGPIPRRKLVLGCVNDGAFIYLLYAGLLKLTARATASCPGS